MVETPINQNEQIMQNEPNLRQSQIFITPITIRNYNEKCTMDSWSKRTQNKPNQTQFYPPMDGLSPHLQDTWAGDFGFDSGGF